MAGVTLPFFSIIIPTLNAEKTLETALGSCLRQEWSDFEILVIDSVSKDGTIDMAKASAAKDGRVRLISEPDQGIYDAMNKGVGLARGQWLFFLGSDDRLYDDKVLGTVAAALREHGPTTDLLYGNVVGNSYKGAYDGAFSFEKLLTKNISHQAIFYKRGVFDSIGNYQLRYRAHADWDFNIRCFANDQIKTRYLDLVVAEFGPDGISSRHDVPFIREVLIPRKLVRLQEQGVGRLRNVASYDEWWRLLRNAGIREPRELGEAPAALQRMIRWQSRMAPATLRKGLVSKCLMFASYLVNLLTGSL